VGGLEVGFVTSGAEEVGKRAPGARACEAMNKIGASFGFGLLRGRY
jgi:hypothetical protein